MTHFPKLALFDFDGTLCNSHALFIESYKKIAEIYKLDTDFFNRPETAHLSSREILKKLNIPQWKVPIFLKKGREFMSEHKDQLELFPGIPEVFQKLQKQDHIYLGIITSNSFELVHSVLSKYQLSYLKVDAGISLFGKSRRIKKMIKHYQVEPENTYYFGDETRDMESSHKAKVKSCAVTWGFHAKEVLTKFNPDFILDNPQEILKILL